MSRIVTVLSKTVVNFPFTLSSINHNCYINMKIKIIRFFSVIYSVPPATYPNFSSHTSQ